MSNPWVIDNVHILLRLLLAMLLGGLIGFERERTNHAAGLRTHILVCLGSALIMLLSVYGFSDFVREFNVRIDPARLATAVITGIGFLGAGTILFTGKSITGLTTAASIWVVGAVGLAVGAGFYFAAIVSTLLILLNLVVFNKLEQRYIRGSKMHLITLYAANSPGLLDHLSALLKEEGCAISKLVVNERSSVPYGEPQPAVPGVEIMVHVLTDRKFDPVNITRQIQGLGQVSMVSVE
ncbi:MULTISPECIES: MgtC/SapB family protein [Paenibacillus]|uniref:Magnesium transporter MgtC n=1 Tax=Paenibacillus campinasensis TaxID=66347 RepID=A0A268EML8_9BACL|nr:MULTISPECIES: MgtC/SapB family protein [Paenibacillus]MUG66938.1 magnesium transporter MgtC [Paenibacillus campinasensis]PAD74367.1 magnesium transporter MgtC [Paenibacillus campinasensis]PAK50868.1 magnesium transporter MgtC [Paenibacillus sp. 7541]